MDLYHFLKKHHNRCTLIYICRIETFRLRKLTAPRELDPAFLITSFILRIRIRRYKTQNAKKMSFFLRIRIRRYKTQNSLTFFLLQIRIRRYKILSLADAYLQIHNSKLSTILSLLTIQNSQSGSSFFCLRKENLEFYFCINCATKYEIKNLHFVKQNE
jgi:hypothetical protein